MSDWNRRGFWGEVFARQESVAPRVLGIVGTFGVIAFVLVQATRFVERLFDWKIALEVTPFEFAGAALGVLLVFRTNAGYDRWWEARKLWGGFVDRTRNLVISALCYGPDDAAWRDQLVRWTAVFPHVARHALRGELPANEITALVGAEETERIRRAEHMPAYVAGVLARLLRQACDQFGMDRFAFLQIDRERVLLVDNFGGCERIRNTPIPLTYSLKIRHFIFLFLVSLPIALMYRLDSDWQIPFITMLAAYPLVSLDQLGIELENPFAAENLSHLPIDGLCAAMEKNVTALLREKQTSGQ